LSLAFFAFAEAAATARSVSHLFLISHNLSFQHFHARRLLLIRLFGSLAVLALVNFFFIPVILAQKESLREPPSGCGALSPGFVGFALL
jgi:hypothetical protein